MCLCVFPRASLSSFIYSLSIACNDIANCKTDVTCTSSTTSKCFACKAGYRKESGTADRCLPNFEGTWKRVPRTGDGKGGDTRPAPDRCEPGEYRSGLKCLGMVRKTCLNIYHSACAAISGCAGSVTCTSAITSQCTKCSNGFYLMEGISDKCISKFLLYYLINLKLVRPLPVAPLFHVQRPATVAVAT